MKYCMLAWHEGNLWSGWVKSDCHHQSERETWTTLCLLNWTFNWTDAWCNITLKTEFISEVLLMNSPLDPIPHLSQSHVQKRHGPAKLEYYVHISKQFAKYDMKRGHEHGIMAVYHDLLTEIMCKRRGLKLVWKSNHYQSASSSITKRTWKGRSLQHGTTMFSMANG